MFDTRVEFKRVSEVAMPAAAPIHCHYCLGKDRSITAY